RASDGFGEPRRCERLRLARAGVVDLQEASTALRHGCQALHRRLEADRIERCLAEVIREAVEIVLRPHLWLPRQVNQTRLDTTAQLPRVEEGPRLAEAPPTLVQVDDAIPRRTTDDGVAVVAADESLLNAPRGARQSGVGPLRNNRWGQLCFARFACTPGEQ